MTGAALRAHLEGGQTTLCRCWAVDRRDGVGFGFTDHDRDLAFAGRVFRAATGMTASALAQTAGLAVDNAEAVGALSDAGVTEADILAGRFDGARVAVWLVNWAAPEERALRFAGTIGEVVRSGGAFRAELRGLSEALNQAQGRVYQKPCGAVLGDAACGVDLDAPGYAAEAVVVAGEGSLLRLSGLAGYQEGWFERGRLRGLSGAASGLVGLVKTDRAGQDWRAVELWQALPGLAVGDRVRIEAGCDKRVETCRYKFANLMNYRGFPHIPGEDWLIASPARRV